MARYHATVLSRRSVADTFAYMATFSNAARWDPGVRSAEQLDPGPVGAGTRFRLVVPFLGRRMSLTYRVTEFRPDAEVVLEASNRLIRSTDRISVAPDADGARVGYHADVRLRGPLSLPGSAAGPRLPGRGRPGHGRAGPYPVRGAGPDADQLLSSRISGQRAQSGGQLMRVIVVRHHEADSPASSPTHSRLWARNLPCTFSPRTGRCPPWSALTTSSSWAPSGRSMTMPRSVTGSAPSLDWLRQADAAGVPVLGICFGAQALSAALGGRVEPARARRSAGPRSSRWSRASFRRARGWNFTRISACRRPARGCWPVTMWACRPSPSAGTWPSSSILR